MRYLSRSLGLAASAVVLVATSALAEVFQATPHMSGFSADGDHYVFLETSRDTGAGILKAKLQIVNLPKNNCVSTGCIETSNSESQPTATTDKDLLAKTWKLRTDLGLAPPQAGTRLDIISRAVKPDKTEIVQVQLKNSKETIKLQLRQKNIRSAQSGYTDKDRASMQLDVTRNGKQRSLDSLDNFRDWVYEYSIKEVYLSPDGQHVAVLITMTEPTFEGVLETTLVQGFEL